MKLQLFQFLIEGLDLSQGNRFSKGFHKTSECGRISTDNGNRILSPPIRASCDFITTNELSPSKSCPILESIYQNCKHIRSKISQDSLNADEIHVRNDWAQQHKQTIKSLISSLKKLYKQDLVDFGILKSLYYLRVLSIRPESSIIVIGDLHGSMHTLLRHLHRFSAMGLLDLETLEFKDVNIKLVFLGDAVDRGIGSLEVITMIFNLMVVNPNQVFYNKGNHETREMNEKYGLKDELKTRGVLDLYEQINELFDLFSCAIVLKLKKPNTKDRHIWLSHGGFESKYISSRKLNFNDAFVPFEPSQFIVGTLWHDFKENEDESERGTHIVNFNRYDLTDFLDNNDVDFIIRGHQDKYNNSYLFGPDFDPQFGERLSGFGLNYLSSSIIGQQPIVVFNKKQKTPNRFDGPIAVIEASKEKFKMSKRGFYYANVVNEVDIYNRNMVVFPCLVISTNTDYLRDLVCDSFVLLS